MTDFNNIFSNKKQPPRYLQIAWKLQLGARDHGEWISADVFDQRYKHRISIPVVNVCIAFDQEKIQKLDIDQLVTATGSCQIDEATTMIDQHELTISVTGLNGSTIWNNEYISLAVNFLELQVQGISVKNVFREHLIITQNGCQQFKITSPVYQWLLDHHDCLLQAMQ